MLTLDPTQFPTLEAAQASIPQGEPHRIQRCIDAREGDGYAVSELTPRKVNQRLRGILSPLSMKRLAILRKRLHNGEITRVTFRAIFNSLK